MGGLEAIRNLYEYNKWANDRVVAAATVLSEDQLRREAGVSMGSALANLQHIVDAQTGWLAFWQGSERQQAPEPPQDRALEWLRERYARSHEELARFVRSLTEADSGRALEYTDRDGVTYRWLLWQLMCHVANHGTQHRAETGLALMELGSSPGDLDYGHFCDIRGSAAPGSLEMVRTLYGYNEWANGRILAALAGLSDEELLRPRGVSHNSLGMDLLHLVGGQVGWLSNWQEGAPWVPLPAAASGRFDDNLADWFRRSQEAIREFIGSLTGEELGEKRTDQMPGGRSRQMLLWDMMLHVVNHGTQHRSEAAMALTAMGRSPGDLDFLDYVDEREGGRGK
ncbi:MAG TPA: DinB family protein [Dehalococcoidia bacterium]|nr:DinB family protein [Dehalococcoidia bacterium]